LSLPPPQTKRRHAQEAAEAAAEAAATAAQVEQQGLGQVVEMDVVEGIGVVPLPAADSASQGRSHRRYQQQQGEEEADGGEHDEAYQQRQQAKMPKKRRRNQRAAEEAAGDAADTRATISSTVMSLDTATMSLFEDLVLGSEQNGSASAADHNTRASRKGRSISSTSNSNGVEVEPSQDGSSSTTKFMFDGKWRTAAEFKALKQREGVTIREGRYTKREDELLRKGVDDFLQTHQLEMAELEKFLFETKKEKRSGSFKEFWSSIGTALPERPVESLYAHLRRLYHPGNHAGAWTTEEDETLKKLVLEEGRKWELISSKMGRFPGSLRDRYRELSVREPAKGSWSEKEDELLRSAVRQLSTSSEKDIPWTLVAQQVPGRSHHQCRTHWHTVLLLKDKSGERRPRWNPEDDLALVDRIVKLQYDDEEEIQWSFVPEGTLLVRGTARCRERWASLKKRANYMGTDVQEAAAAVRKYVRQIQATEELEDEMAGLTEPYGESDATGV